ncbi:uncharacterized protein si:ch211-153b23.7 [Thalassophryne amazonica]|uniref:uncharacterized protein si:ch211-153b23.7 n=1 Tax=Thalassophryne amazonica TaxID=390379 RepID=UPI0014719DE3|nr:uncharacterized protein si:ch211-153b23.7 [Thalassophryne amazonica]
MDGDVLSVPPSTSAAAELPNDSLPEKDSSLLQSQEEHKSVGQTWTEEDVSAAGERLLSVEEITESMTVTSNDQEKLLLLNKNTELRRVNKELMKLNDDWDQVYRSATMGLQNRVKALELENSAIKQLNHRMLLKVEHQQGAKEYYEQALMQEFKKNQDLQEYIALLESRIQQPDHKDGSTEAGCRTALCPTNTNAPGGPAAPPSHISDSIPLSCLFLTPSSLEAGLQGRRPSSCTPLGNSQQELQDLKEQLAVLRCQTQIYEAEYQTEHSDHKNTQQENRRLRRKREEMRQQVALLQEQLRIYEDDFRRERSDKQMLQRLLLKKMPPHKDPVLIHRCNNDQQPLGGDNRTKRGEKVHQQSKQYHPLCPKHCNKDSA